MKKIVITILMITSLLVSACGSDSEYNQRVVDLENNLMETEELLNTQTSLVESISEDLDSLENENKKLKEQIETLESEQNQEYTTIEERIGLLERKQAIDNLFIENLDEYEIVCGWIENYSSEEMILSFDDMEWVSAENVSRVNELGLDLDNDFPNGFTLYNQSEGVKTYQIDSDFVIYLFQDQIDWKYQYMTSWEFEERVNDSESVFCDVILLDGVVVGIIERYIC